MPKATVQWIGSVFLSSLSTCGSCGASKNSNCRFFVLFVLFILHLRGIPIWDSKVSSRKEETSTVMKKHYKNLSFRPASSNHVDTVAKKKVRNNLDIQFWFYFWLAWYYCWPWWPSFLGFLCLFFKKFINCLWLFNLVHSHLRYIFVYIQWLHSRNSSRAVLL